jgi:adenylosuccinate lyase
LAEKVGKAVAHEWIEAHCKTVQATQKHLKTVLLEAPQIREYLSEAEIEMLFDPVNALGECDRLIDGVIAV